MEKPLSRRELIKYLSGTVIVLASGAVIRLPREKEKLDIKFNITAKPNYKGKVNA